MVKKWRRRASSNIYETLVAKRKKVTELFRTCVCIYIWEGNGYDEEGGRGGEEIAAGKIFTARWAHV